MTATVDNQTPQTGYGARVITDWEIELAAVIIEKYVRSGAASGRLRDSTIYAADRIRKVWGLGYDDNDPTHFELPAVFTAEPDTVGTAVAVLAWHMRRWAEGAPYSPETAAEVTPALVMLGYPA